MTDLEERLRTMSDFEVTELFHRDKSNERVRREWEQRKRARFDAFMEAELELEKK